MPCWTPGVTLLNWDLGETAPTLKPEKKSSTDRKGKPRQTPIFLSLLFLPVNGEQGFVCPNLLLFSAENTKSTHMSAVICSLLIDDAADGRELGCELRLLRRAKIRAAACQLDTERCPGFPKRRGDRRDQTRIQEIFTRRLKRSGSVPRSQGSSTSGLPLNPLSPRERPC